LGARFRVDREFAGDINVDPGEEFTYQLGVGFAVNSRITLSTIFTGGYVVEDKVNTDRIEGGNLEPMRMRFAITIARPKLIVEPFADIGITDDAPSAVTGITWTR